MRKFLVTGVLLASFIGRCSAAETDPADGWSKVSPFINANTLAVVSLDLPRIDLVSLEKKFIDSIDRSAAQRANAARLIDKWKDWSSQLAAQRGGRVYAVFTLEYQPNLLQPTDSELLKSLFFLIPSSSGLTSIQVRDLEDTLRAIAPSQPTFKLRNLHGVDVLAEQSVLDKLATLQPSARPGFEQAMTAAGDQPLRFAIAPPEILQRTAKEILLQSAPGADKPLGQVLADGLRWLGVGVDPNGNNFNVAATIQSKDATSAAALSATLKTSAEQLIQQLNRRSDDRNEALPAAISSLLPEQKDDRLVLSYTQERAAAFGVFFQRVLGAAQAGNARKISQNNMKHLNLAILNYEDKYKSLPDRAIRSKDGRPLLSWRVAILPYLDEDKLFKEFHLDEPWDSEHNRKLVDRMPDIFKNPIVGNRQLGRTRYLAPVGEALYFPPDRGLKFKDIKDGTSKTIMLVEADPEHAVIWTKPDDLEVDLSNPARGLGRGDDIFNASFGDGSVSGISVSTPTSNLRGLFTRDGGEIVER